LALDVNDDGNLRRFDVELGISRRP
jgi:hypothetical protein